MEEFNSPTPMIYCTGNGGGDFIPKRPPTTDHNEWDERSEIEQGELRMFKIFLKHRYEPKTVPPTSGVEFSRAITARAYELLRCGSEGCGGSANLRQMRATTTDALRERSHWLNLELISAINDPSSGNPFAWTLPGAPTPPPPEVQPLGLAAAGEWSPTDAEMAEAPAGAQTGADVARIGAEKRGADEEPALPVEQGASWGRLLVPGGSPPKRRRFSDEGKFKTFFRDGLQELRDLERDGLLTADEATVMRTEYMDIWRQRQFE